MWSLLWHRPFSDFLNFRTATSFEFGNGKDALQPKTISTKWYGNIPDSPDWVSGHVWKRNIAMVLGPRPPRGNSFQEKDSHSPDRPQTHSTPGVGLARVRTFLIFGTAERTPFARKAKLDVSRGKTLIPNSDFCRAAKPGLGKSPSFIQNSKTLERFNWVLWRQSAFFYK